MIAPDVRLAPSIRCARCGHTCSADVWRSWPRQQTLTSADLTGYVSRWPSGVSVEVRACVGCGRAMARAVAATASRVASGVSET
jgi:hypothetical protein